MTARWLPAASALLALALTLALAAVALALGGYPPIEAFGALVRGALGSPSAILSITLVRTVPLLLTGLAVALAFRAGVWNIGAEGQFYAGAVAAVWMGLQVGGWPVWIAVPSVLLAAAVAGAAWAAIPALMKLRLGVGEVITTLLLNFVAIDLSAWLVHGPLQEPRGVFPQSESIAEVAQLPLLIPGTRLHVGFALALVLAVVLAFVMRSTRAGFFVRAVGASPDAARVAGRVRVARVVGAAFLVSGALAGLAGGVEVAGVTYALYEDLSPGHGYTAIAVALLAGLHPIGVVGTAFLFGVLEGGASSMQRIAGVPAAWVNGIQALVILSVLVVDRVVRHGWVAGGRDG
ncbi:MAG: ABC transporter permease [Gemmatimonadetes bacterium]|nr:ABC transporter permease [Gemmatimonadota bacterium]NNF37525.1 ABC transporter permease [Gemmatimonadota bacterium]NNK63276.1 ABC transporter permease [Gemmatimonadota bacterium]